jgi:hypothetical protein
MARSQHRLRVRLGPGGCGVGRGRRLEASRALAQVGGLEGVERGRGPGQSKAPTGLVRSGVTLWGGTERQTQIIRLTDLGDRSMPGSAGSGTRRAQALEWAGKGVKSVGWRSRGRWRRGRLTLSRETAIVQAVGGQQRARGPDGVESTGGLAGRVVEWIG